MDRVIKFRAQQFNHGKHGFQYGSYVTDNKDYHAIIKESKSSPDEMYNMLINPKTLGQFTGLQDKNGVDIYEGDNIETTNAKNDGGKMTATVKFFNGVVIGYRKGMAQNVSLLSDDLIVTGNIHQNPDLLT